LTTRISNLPLLAPGTKPPRINPRKALHHFKKLIANKEDTAEVFHVLEALAGNHLSAMPKTFSILPMPGTSWIAILICRPCWTTMSDFANYPRTVWDKPMSGSWKKKV